MSKDNIDFAKRLKRIEKSHRGAARVTYKSKGYQDAIDQQKAADAKRKRAGAGVWLGRILVAYVLFAFVKACLAVRMGEESYVARIAEIQSGEGAGPVAAFVMGLGPVEQVMALVVSGFVSAAPEQSQQPAPEEAAPAQEPSSEN